MKDGGRGTDTISVQDLLTRSAESALSFQREDGSFPSGRNYQYDEPGTPVRPTAHWLTTFSEIYRVTSEEIYREAATDALEYLLSTEARPHGHTFYCRNAPGKDACNGLIGQAYPIRALAHAGNTLDRSDALETALEVYDLHPFDRRVGLWEVIEVTGEPLSFDRTLNHQLAFAAAASELLEFDDQIESDLRAFLAGLRYNMRVDDEGLIRHLVRPRPTTALEVVIRKPRHWRLIPNEALFHVYAKSSERRRKEIGYQSVNLHWLALLKRALPGASLWERTTIERAAAYVHSAAYRSVVADAERGSTVPGMRTAWAEYLLNGRPAKQAATQIERTLERKLDPETYLLTSKSVESIDQSATVSFLVGFPNVELAVPKNSGRSDTRHER